MATSTIKGSNTIRFPDYTRGAIHQITTQGASWTATEDGWMIGTMSVTSYKAGPRIMINDSVVAGTYMSTSSGGLDMPIHIPFKKGDVIKTRNNTNGDYNLSFFGMR